MDYQVRRNYDLEKHAVFRGADGSMVLMDWFFLYVNMRSLTLSPRSEHILTSSELIPTSRSRLHEAFELRGSQGTRLARVCAVLFAKS